MQYTMKWKRVSICGRIISAFVLIFVVFALLASTIVCRGPDLLSPEPNPAIEFTYVPPYGSAFDLHGRIRDANPNSYKIAVYVFVEGAGWWTKPSFSDPLTSINEDSTWQVDITTGGSDIYATRIQAFLLPIGVGPQLAEGLACLPNTLNSIAAADVDSTRNSRLISFSGYQWWVKASASLVGPGPNFFSNSIDNVWVDGNGNLHLKITKRNGSWYCPEVILTDSFGVGRYVFQITGQIGKINENVVLGIFSWDNYDCTQNHREIDIEFSRWNNSQDLGNAQYVVQPWNMPGNRQRWHMPVTMDSSTHSFTWERDKVAFLSVKGHQFVQPYDSILCSWSYTGSDIPTTGKETIRMNLWLDNGIPPSDGQEVEVVISKFNFLPH